MAKAMEIPKYYQKGFKKLASLSDEEFEFVAKTLEETPVGTSPSQFTAELKSIEPEDERRELSRSVWSMGTLRSNFPRTKWRGLSLGLAEGIFATLLSTEEQVDGAIDRIAQRCYRLLECSSSAAYASKAYELLNSQHRTLEKFRVITDIRPVFGDDIEKDLFYSVIFHNLVFNVKEGDRETTFSIAVDLPEVESIKKELDRAIEKERIIRAGTTRALPYIRHYKVDDE
ncbi:MAG TPA: hypothetical protein PLN54_09585 [Flavobacteriales bacterium]|nr:hypothetical protein [Flavobacteriales bacterium]